ncbi:MAG: glycosyltransferase family 39 protein [Candidatus Zixiibacteriota bacterium]|nr:MAG: glycosyltransferase family 39 protein [candidate division Zixibacteria bacterium]
MMKIAGRIFAAAVNLFGDRPGYVLAFCAGLFLALGYGQDGINLDSATYAVIARNMAESGSWLNPHYTAFWHNAFGEHPPLVMWAQGLIFLLLDPNDSSARIFGALCTLGSVLCLYAIGRRVDGRGFGFLCGAVLLLTYNYLQIGNSTHLDVPMTMFVLASLLVFLIMERSSVTSGRAVLLGVLLGCAWLSKGVVSGPIWVGLALAVLIWHRQWLGQRRFWLIPAVAIGIIVLHLAIDQIFAGGRFWDHYIQGQISRRFLGRSTEEGNPMWLFSWRFVQLYLPFVILLPIGAVEVLRKRIRLLYPALITLILYWTFYSTAAILFYHYYVPVYALAAPLVALPVWRLLGPARTRKVVAGFACLWIIAAAGVGIAGVRLHEIRTPELYSLRDQMNVYLSDRPSRDGVVVGSGEPNWDHVAKAAWYWRSDLQKDTSFAAALAGLQSGRYAYILADKSDTSMIGNLVTARVENVRELVTNDKIMIYIYSPTPAADST